MDASHESEQRWFKVAYPMVELCMECCCYLRKVHDKMAGGKTHNLM